jgi:DNA-binding PadR family transcriptional regulator
MNAVVYVRPRSIGDRDAISQAVVSRMRSAVNAGVLSLVIEQPSYGGEIGRRFEERYDGLLSSRPQHIYKALDELRAQGLVEPIVLDDGSGVGQQVRGYRATANGARAYRGWLRSPIQAGSRTRHEVMIRLASTRPEDRETAAFLLDAYERAVLALARRHPVRTDNVIDRLLDEEHRTLADAQLRWIAHARDELRSAPGARRG